MTHKHTSGTKHPIISDLGIKFIKYFEGFHPKPYVCPAGLLTIGYGHVIMPNEKFDEIDEEMATQILIKDLTQHSISVARLIHVPLTQNQRDALISFSFNVGSGRLQASTLRSKLNRGEYVDAADEFLRWVYAGGKKLRGLVRRREAERNVFLYGIYLT